MAVANPSTVYIYDDDHITAFAGAAVTGSRFVKVGGAGGVGNKPSVINSTVTATDVVIGVAMGSAAQGEDVIVFAEGVIGVTASGALTKGTPVTSGAAGVAIAATGSARVAGVVTADTADQALAPVLLLGL